MNIHLTAQRLSTMAHCSAREAKLKSGAERRRPNHSDLIIIAQAPLERGFGDGVWHGDRGDSEASILKERLHTSHRSHPPLSLELDENPEYPAITTSCQTAGSRRGVEKSQPAPGQPTPVPHLGWHVALHLNDYTLDHQPADEATVSGLLTRQWRVCSVDPHYCKATVSFMSNKRAWWIRPLTWLGASS